MLSLSIAAETPEPFNDDQSLVMDLEVVMNAPRVAIEKSVEARAKVDREEIKRILGHLPVVREARDHRDGPLTGVGAGVVAAPAKPASARSQGSRGVTPRGTTPRGAAYIPRPPTGDRPSKAEGALMTSGSRQGSRISTPRLATPRIGNLSAGSGPLDINTAPAITTPRGTTPRGATPRGATPQVTKEAKSGAAVGPALMPLDEQCDIAAVEAQRRATEVAMSKLNEFGIDPEGMSAADILRMYYARGVGTSYMHANRAVDQGLQNRVHTPQSFGGVLKTRALQEVRRARELPASHVHECLDKWEIENLAEICRSLKHFDEVAAGKSSAYTRSYSSREYGGKIDRHPLKRQADPQ